MASGPHTRIRLVVFLAPSWRISNVTADESRLAWWCMRVGGSRGGVQLVVQETSHQALELDDAIVKRSKAAAAAQL